MTFPDLTFAREIVASMHNDTCSITLPGDIADAVLDPVTLELTPPADAALYDGDCSVSVDNVDPRPGEEGGAERTVERYRVKLPYGAPAIPEGARVEVTAVAEDHDPAMVGLVLWVISSPLKSLTVQRVLRCSRIRPQPDIGEAP